MLERRFAPAVVSCRGKVYVFGCSETTTVDPWGEFFDPLSGKWSPLSMPNPPPDNQPLDRRFIIQPVSCVAFEDKEMILMASSSCIELFCLDVRDNTWSCPISIPKGECIPKLVSAGNLLYLFYGLDAYVYHLDKQGLPEKVHDIGACVPKSCGVGFPLYPFYLGEGLFCLVWSPLKHYKASPTTRLIHCLKIEITTGIDYNRKCFPEASFVGLNSYIVDGRGMTHCVAVGI